MWNVRGMFASGMVVLLASLPAWSAESGLDTKAAKFFKVKWSSISYSKSATIRNPDASSPTQSQPAGQHRQESLSLSGRIEILDPDRVLGTCQQGVLTQLVDGAGRDVNVLPTSSSLHRFYESPRYVSRFSQPPQVPKWQAFIQRVLRLPSPNANFQPQRVEELQPSSLNVGLDWDSLKQTGEIRRVKGYFYAVIPDSIETIDVPFEPNNAWIQLTPDLEIQVQEATCSGAMYRYSMQTRGQGRMPLSSRSPSLHLTTPLPSRLVQTQQFIGLDGQPMPGVSGGGGSSSGGGMGKTTGSGSGLTGPIKAFRFIIAVNPSERKIPFEFEHIPLPKP